MVEYTAKDGLNVLTYLGILNLTEEEKKVFRKEWGNHYDFNKDFIGSIWILYSEALPFICGDSDRNSFATAQIRDTDFCDRLEKSKLEAKLKKGIPLKEVFDESPQRFAKLN